MIRNKILTQTTWSLGDISLLLGVDRRTLLKEMQGGRLPHMTIGNRYIFVRSDLDTFLTPERAAIILAPKETPTHAENE